MDRQFLISSHITDLEGPTEALIDFINKSKFAYRAILLPLHYCSNRTPKIVDSRSPELIKLRPYTSGIIVSCVKDFFTTLRYGWLYKKNGLETIYIGVDPLNCLAGVLLKLFGRIDRVVFYTIDWTPKRFTNPLLNSLYHTIDRVCTRYSDVNWNLTEKINMIRTKFSSCKKNHIVPVGAYLQNKSATLEPLGTSVVLLGALAPSKGVELVLQSWPIVLSKIPYALLHVIGKTPNDCIEDGIGYDPYEPRFAALGKSVVLHGAIPRKDVYDQLVNMDVGDRKSVV